MEIEVFGMHDGYVVREGGISEGLELHSEAELKEHLRARHATEQQISEALEKLDSRSGRGRHVRLEVTPA